uniref:(northern house mosquito) hypothetical protein n=1 Tax=Culex pipiens TaxID=7175 RepID=A0A8D8JQ15_CULPI
MQSPSAEHEGSAVGKREQFGRLYQDGPVQQNDNVAVPVPLREPQARRPSVQTVRIRVLAGLGRSIRNGAPQGPRAESGPAVPRRRSGVPAVLQPVRHQLLFGHLRAEQAGPRWLPDRGHRP